jgi:hypothetical protein
MSQHFEDYKTLLDLEAKRLSAMMDNFDELISIYKDAQHDLIEEDFKALEAKLDEIEDHEDCPMNVLKSVDEARHQLEKEDPVILEAKLVLG